MAGVVLVAAGGGGLAYAWYSAHSPPGNCPSASGNGGNTPLGSYLALGSPAESRWDGHFGYNFSVQSAGGGVVLSDLRFQVQTGTGFNVSPAGFTMAVLGFTHAAVANYSMTTGNWSSGGDTLLTSQQTVSLVAPEPLSGDSLLMFVTTACASGSVTVAIP